VKNGFTKLRVWWLLSFLVKWGLSSITPLAPDEAYYWFWSFFPQLSYFDHPGMIAWLFRLGQFFSFLPYGERLPGLVIGHLAFGLWLLIAWDRFSEKITRQFFGLYLALPFLGLGSLLQTPDLPLTFFWALSLWFFLEWEQRPHPTQSLLLGLSMGLGFCSKYHMVLFPLSLLFYAGFENKKLLQRRLELGLIILAGLIGSLPVLIWNYKNHWVSFLFQAGHGLGQANWSPHWTSDYLAGQVLLFTPLLFWFFFKAQIYQRLRIFYWLALIPWIFFFFSSFRGAVQANWPIISLAPALLLALVSLQRPWMFKAVLAAWVAPTLIVFSVWLYPWLESAPEKLTEVHLLRSKIEQAKAYQPLFGGSYQIASLYSYYSGQKIHKLFQMSRRDQFDFWSGSEPTTREFFVLREKNEALPDWVNKARGHSQVVIDLSPFEIVKVSL
jgi:4-amino-4-deoxy-L-arabinose transferase-like glycosyltransferase